MAEIEKLPPLYPIPPVRPGARRDEGERAPQQGPRSGEDGQDRRRRKQHDDDAPHIDEYA